MNVYMVKVLVATDDIKFDPGAVILTALEEFEYSKIISCKKQDIDVESLIVKHFNEGTAENIPII